MEAKSYECPACHHRKRASLGIPRCSCGRGMINTTGRPLYMYECPACHKRKRSALGIPRCSCGRGMIRVN